MQLNTKKLTNPGRKSKQIFIQRRHADGQKTKNNAKNCKLLEKCKSKLQ